MDVTELDMWFYHDQTNEFATATL